MRLDSEMWRCAREYKIERKTERKKWGQLPMIVMRAAISRLREKQFKSNRRRRGET